MKFRSLLATVSLAFSSALFAGNPVVRSISLEDCLQIAFQQNLDLQISRYLPELSELTLEGDRGAYDPRYSFGYTASKDSSPGNATITDTKVPPNVTWAQRYNMGLNGLLPSGGTYSLTGPLNAQRTLTTGLTNIVQSTVSSQGPGISVSQPLLKNMWIDQTRMNIAIAKKQVLSDEQAVRAQLIQTATDVQVAYYTLAATRESVRVQEKAVELAARLLTENRKRVEVGAMAPLEGKQAEAQVATSRADLISAQQNYGVAENTLKRLLTSNYAELEDVTYDPSDRLVPQPYLFSRQESWSRGLSARPDIIQSQIAMEQQNITVRFQRNQVLPELDVNSAFGLTAQAHDVSTALSQLGNVENKNFSIGGSITFPLGNRTARSALSSAKLERARLILRHKQLEQSVLVTIDNAILVAQSSYERVQANRQARIYAEAALDAEQKKLENGKSTTFEVLRLQRDLTSAASDEVRSVVDYFNAMALLFQDEGSTLERLGVKVTAN